MPYIKSTQRILLDPAIQQLAKNISYVSHKIETDDGNQRLTTLPGLTNYTITALLLTILSEYDESYAMYNMVIGVLEDVKLELYRKHIAPYESQKEFENGPVMSLIAA